MTKADEKPALAKSSAKPAAKKASAAEKRIAAAPSDIGAPIWRTPSLMAINAIKGGDRRRRE